MLLCQEQPLAPTFSRTQHPVCIGDRTASLICPLLDDCLSKRSTPNIHGSTCAAYPQLSCYIRSSTPTGDPQAGTSSSHKLCSAPSSIKPVSVLCSTARWSYYAPETQMANNTRGSASDAATGAPPRPGLMLYSGQVVMGMMVRSSTVAPPFSARAISSMMALAMVTVEA